MAVVLLFLVICFGLVYSYKQGRIPSEVKKMMLERTDLKNAPSGNNSHPAGEFVNRPRSHGINADMREVTQSSYAQKSVKAEPKINRMMDDREHDWLAGQLAAERVAKRNMSAMFDLKMEHKHNCEAEMLRAFHAENCDAEGIDNATAK